MSRLLVTYATQHGSTEEVAKSIAAQLRDADHDVEFLPAGSVDDLTSYDGIVLGGAIYMGRWHGEARRFVRRHHAALQRLPFAVFALGPLSLEEEDVASSRKQLDAALARLDVEPDLVRVFGGVVDPAKLHFPFTRMAKTDARDWEAINDWALCVALHFSYRAKGPTRHAHA
jgi:menaquinone-dependent protoporphyrinogen oxidase